MASRLELHEELCELLGSRNVYYQPPENLKMIYPCIRYSKSDVATKKASDRIYIKDNRYEITVIDKNPDSAIPDSILERFPYCSFDRWYPSNNLNHFVLTLYY